jgi:hypothetical protein
MPHVLPSDVVKYMNAMFIGWMDGPHNPAIGHGSAPVLTAVVALAEKIPAHLLTITPSRYATYLAALETIRGWIPAFHARGVHVTFEGHPIRIVRNTLADCPDEFPSPTTHALPFIDDRDLREQLRLDIEHVDSALGFGQWKAATVLAGSVIEALLLWKLGTLPPVDVQAAEQLALKRKAPRPPNEWHLHEFIEVAAIVPTTNAAIVPDTVALLRVVRSYRNLIHPGRAERLAQKCDKSTAYAAVAGMEGVVRDLGR